MGKVNAQTLKRFLNATRDVYKRCSVVHNQGLGFYASPPDGKYPFIYTRDFSVAIVALSELGDWTTAKKACRFLLDCQCPTGEWVQRYGERAQRQERVIQEDNTPLATWALLTYAGLSGDEGFRKAIRERVLTAADFMLGTTLHAHAYLATTHTSMHEAEVSEGFEIWNTCAHAKAFRLVAETYGLSKYGRYADLIERAIRNLLTYDGRFLRRLDVHGNPDFRVDITLITPSYFDLCLPNDPLARNSAALIERVLKDAELGGYSRYLTFSDLETSILPGPWFLYTAWMARYHHLAGDRKKGDENLTWIMTNSKDFYLSEYILTKPRWERYKDVYMKRVYAAEGCCLAACKKEFEKLSKQAEEGEVIYGVLPLLWAHVETLRALQAGGYLQTFDLEG